MGSVFNSIIVVYPVFLTCGFPNAKEVTDPSCDHTCRY